MRFAPVEIGTLGDKSDSGRFDDAEIIVSPWCKRLRFTDICCFTYLIDRFRGDCRCNPRKRIEAHGEIDHLKEFVLVAKQTRDHVACHAYQVPTYH